MKLRLYDTATRQIRDFTSKVPGEVGIYLCGATVQAEPHIGHMRSVVSYDILRRWLEYAGNKVTFVRNVTDIDDKILVKSAEQNVSWWALAYGNERAFDAGYDILGCLPPTYAPRATGHVPEMIALIRTLIDTGHAYAAGGDVLFDVHSYSDYGALSNQRLDNMRPAEDADTSLKRDPRDFALWKGHKANEPKSASWPTAWGPGRPGWHLECSAMASKYLGAEFDIHGGGQDLIFPHHENEIAQSRAAGQPFARYWVHHALVSFSGEKMSKSLGNIETIPGALRRARAVEIRYYLATPHYRSIIDYTPASLGDAVAAYRRLEGFVLRATERVGSTSPSAELPAEFVAAMDDDLSTPKAVATIHDAVRLGNQALADGDEAAVREALGSVRGMLAVLGLDPIDPQWSDKSQSDLHTVVDGLVSLALDQRQAARDRKDYAAADAIRDQLKRAGIVIEDTAAGPRWTLTE